MDESLDVLSVLSSSQHRIPMTRYLVEGPASVRDVADHLDVPRATAKHNLDRLREADLVEETTTGYAATTFGTFVVEHVEECLDSIAVTGTLRSFLDVAPRSAFEYDPALFQGATVTSIEPTNPHAPVERFVELVGRTDHVGVVTPVLLPRIFEVFHRNVVERELELDLVVPGDVVDLLESQFPGQLEEVLDSGRVVIGVFPGEIPYGVSLWDETITLAGYDDQNILRSLVECDSPEATRWAENRYREYEQGVETFLS